MIKHASRAFLLAFLTVVGLAFMAPLSASAAPAGGQLDPGCLPQFNPSQHVYVADNLAHNKNYPQPLSGLDAQVQSAASKHNLSVYVVACQSDFAVGEKPAVQVGNQVEKMWEGDSNFPKDRFLLIVYIRMASDPSHGSIAANGGTYVQSFGMDANGMGANDGPVLKAIPQLKQDPAGGIVAIVDNVNGNIDHTLFMRALPGIILKIVLALLLLISLTILFIRFRRHSKKAQAAIADWTTRLDKANQGWITLHGSYFDFLQEQGTDWKNKFKGETLKTYTSAVSLFADLTVRLKTAQNLLDSAKKKSHGIFPLTVGYDKAVRMLTVDDVTVTGNALPVEMMDLFSGTVAQTTFKPEDLLADANDKFVSCNQQLAKIVDDFRKSREAADEIKATVAQIDGLKPQLEGNGLPFGPYQVRYDKVQTDSQAQLAVLASDPIATRASLESIADACEALKGDLERALSIVTSIKSAQGEIDKAAAHATDQRSKAIGFAYPEGTVPGGTTPQFLLNEQGGGNPDDGIAKAKEQLAAAQTAVVAGRLDEAVKDVHDAAASAKAAFTLVDSIVSAKAAVEGKVPQVRTNLATLTGEIPAATQAVSELRGDFLAKNFPGMGENLDHSNQVVSTTEGKLAVIQKAYFEQRFLAAQIQVNDLGGDIQGSRDGLVAIHSRLAELKRLRQDARDTVAAAEQLSNALKSKLSTNSFTTSAATDTQYAALVPSVERQKADVAQKVTDWPAASDAAHKMLSGFQAIDKAIDNEKADHDRATAKAQELSGAISSAQGSFNSYTRREAKSRLQSAQQALSSVQSHLSQAKSDWGSIASAASNALSDAQQAEQLADGDTRAARQAESAISRAASEISGAQSSFGRGVMANYSGAESELSSARSSLSSGDYERAEQYANSAYNTAQREESAAQARLAAIIAAEEEERRREEQRRRDQEAAEERARQASSSSSSGGTDFGGGGSGGGSISGGGSGGGDW